MIVWATCIWASFFSVGVRLLVGIDSLRAHDEDRP